MGATEALFASFSTILNPGDEVIIPTPAFGLYEALVQLQGGVPVSLPTEHNHFQIVPEELKAAITDRTKAIILTSPNNPTGCVYTKGDPGRRPRHPPGQAHLCPVRRCIPHSDLL